MLLEQIAIAAVRVVGGGPALTLVAIFAPLLAGALVASVRSSPCALQICLFLASLQTYALGLGLSGLPTTLGRQVAALSGLSPGDRTSLAGLLCVGSALVSGGLVIAMQMTAKRANIGGGLLRRRSASDVFPPPGHGVRET